MKATKEDVLARIIQGAGGCWLWTGALNFKGYPNANVHGRTTTVHRLAYELWVGPIPVGLVVDHLCRNPGCVNPAHLEPCTAAENTRRGGRNLKAMCPRGHLYDEANTIWVKRGTRECRACERLGRRTDKPLRSHCSEGHPFNDANTYMHPAGYQVCRECSKEHYRRYNAKRPPRRRPDAPLVKR